jgi:hypothetical protein
MLRQWQALESWAAAGKLGLLRALIRYDDQPLPGGGYHGDLPDGWTRSLTHEVALTLAMPAVSAEQLMWLAWNLKAVLPGTGGLLAAGDLTLAKARAVDKALGQLTDQDAAHAESLILPDLPGKTYGQAEKLAVQAAITVDPESATRRREDAERHKCRVQLFREDSGAAALSGRDMPTDQTLAADVAVASPHSRICVTVTGPGGIAIGHGCARQKPGKPGKPGTAKTVLASLASLPARVNLTITADRLAELTGPPAATGPPDRSPWIFARHGDTGPPGPSSGPSSVLSSAGPPAGHGTWTLTLPDGRNLTVELEPVPTLDCDHRHESHAYQPNDRLRHLVQVRDGTCTFPVCSRHARESDFEHAVPYDKGGRTCGCNAGARSRTCHQVKQSPGWTVTQPRPGWHQWQTPAGRVYLQGPKRYPA